MSATGQHKPLTCRVMGHRWRFATEQAAVVWICERCGSDGGRREYESPDEARRFAARLNRGAGPPTGFLAALGGGVLRRPRDRD